MTSCFIVSYTKTFITKLYFKETNFGTGWELLARNCTFYKRHLKDESILKPNRPFSTLFDSSLISF